MASETKRGFASMDKDKKSKISSKGGRSVSHQNRSFSKDHELASQAGRKGGEHSHRGQRSESDGDK
jgi:general stress protein YciG